MHILSNWNSLDRNERTLTRSLVFLGLILIFTAMIVGISDNIPGAILLFAGLMSLVYAVVHSWHGQIKFLRLLLYALIGFILSFLLHNLFDLFAGITENSFLHSLLNVVSGLFFILAVIIFPILGFTGLTGYLLGLIKENTPYTH